ncbi:MAG TPA: hypothetical protein ENI23_16455 [bacterium]|nr:hypothetical protein [bacterium]
METNQSDLNIHFVCCLRTEDGINLQHPIYGVSIFADSGNLITIKEDSLHILGMLLEDYRERKMVFEEIEIFEFDY